MIRSNVSLYALINGLRQCLKCFPGCAYLSFFFYQRLASKKSF